MLLTKNTEPPQALLTIDQFCLLYGDDHRCELIDGEVIDLEPTGPHEEIAAFVTLKLCTHIDGADLPWLVLQRGLLRPANATMTAFRPDVMVVDCHALRHEPLWPGQSILTLGSSIKLVVEVVSGNWQNDYARKVEDYGILGIPEYWIVDYAGLGGTRYIGRPKQPTLTIGTLVDGDYQMQLFRGKDSLVSAQFPGLKLTAGQILEGDRR